MRYLESLSNDKRVRGTVLVAGFTDDLGYPELTNFFKTPIDFNKIKQRCDQFVAINSDNDPYVDLKYGNILKEKLGAKLIIKHNKGHFSGASDNEAACLSLPDVTQSILEMTK